MPPPQVGDEPPSWTLEERGSFLVGQCSVCGFRSAARRARYSVASDMRAHEILCHATPAVDRGEPQEVAEARPVLALAAEIPM